VTKSVAKPKPKSSTKTVEKAHVPRSEPVSYEQISNRAFELWLDRGCTHGFALEDWLRAETELQNDLLYDRE
jgi:hypothetical protein